jgi:hypothetical protein
MLTNLRLGRAPLCDREPSFVDKPPFWASTVAVCSQGRAWGFSFQHVQIGGPLYVYQAQHLQPMVSERQTHIRPARQALVALDQQGLDQRAARCAWQ